jgi:hypothetical protein
MGPLILQDRLDGRDGFQIHTAKGMQLFLEMPQNHALHGNRGSRDRRTAAQTRYDLRKRGRPPRLPFSRELADLRSEVRDPAWRANSLIHVFDPKMPAASPATLKSTSSASQ